MACMEMIEKMVVGNLRGKTGLRRKKY